MPTVPIYDGRSGFNFTEEEFLELATLPLYKDGTRDLPEKAVVAVGYSVNTYTGEKSGSTNLSTNVQFVILLGIAAAKL